MKILFFTNLYPFPLDNGGKIKTYTTLKSLKKEGHKITLLCFEEDEHITDCQEIQQLCENIVCVPGKLTTALYRGYMMKKAVGSLFSRYAFSIIKYKSQKMIYAIDELSKMNDFDIVYFDHLPMFIYLRKVKQIWSKAYIILDEHNCEYIISKRNSENSSNLFKKTFLKIEGLKVKAFEKYALENADRVIVLSKEDKNSLKSITKKTIQFTIIPIGMESKVIHHNFSDIDEANILFIGTLTWQPNQDGIIWFIKNVVPKLSNTIGNFSLYIVGKNPSNELIELCKEYENIIITGYVMSVEEYYEKCDYMIVPLFAGSGQRVKIIEGYSVGMPIISTQIGAEGLVAEDGNSILVADTIDQFIDACASMKSGELRRMLSENAMNTFEKNYSFNMVYRQIAKVVEEISEKVE